MCYFDRRRYSTPILREIPNRQTFPEYIDEEALMEKEYAELKNVLGMTTLHSNNSEQLLLIHPRVNWHHHHNHGYFQL